MPFNKKSFLNASKETYVLLQDKGFRAKKVAEVVGKDYNTVCHFLQRHKNDGNINNFNRCGRRRKFTVRCDRKLKRLFKTNRQASARQLMNFYNEGDPNPIGLTTVNKRLKEFGAKRRTLRKSVIIRKENLLKRRKWVKARLNWIVQNDWSRFVYSDECSIYVGKQNGRIKVGRTDEEKDKRYLVPSLHRKLVGCIFWGCITYNGTATLTPISGNINGGKTINTIH